MGSGGGRGGCRSDDTEVVGWGVRVCVCPGPGSPVPVKLGRGVTTRRAGRTLPWDLLARFRAPRWGSSAAPAEEPPARSLQLFSIWARVRQPLFPPRAAELGRGGGSGERGAGFQRGEPRGGDGKACLPSASPTLSGVGLAETGEGAPPRPPPPPQRFCAPSQPPEVSPEGGLRGVGRLGATHWLIPGCPSE